MAVNIGQVISARLKRFKDKLGSGIQAVREINRPAPPTIQLTRQQLSSPRVQRAYQQSIPYMQAAQRANVDRFPVQEVQGSRIPRFNLGEAYTSPTASRTSNTVRRIGGEIVGELANAPSDVIAGLSQFGRGVASRDFSNMRTGGFRTGLGAFNIATTVGGPGVALKGAKALAKTGIRQGIQRGAMTGAGLGAAEGFLRGGIARPGETGRDVAENIATNTALGGLGGLVLGGAAGSIPSVAGIPRRLLSNLKNKPRGRAGQLSRATGASLGQGRGAQGRYGSSIRARRNLSAENIRQLGSPKTIDRVARQRVLDHARTTNDRGSITRLAGNIYRGLPGGPQKRDKLIRAGMKAFEQKRLSPTNTQAGGINFGEIGDAAKKPFQRPADNNPLIQQARKYKSAEEFQNAIKEKFVKEQGFEPTSMNAVDEWWKAKQIQPYIGIGGHAPENFATRPLVSELPKNHPDLRRYNFTKDGKIIMYRGIPKDVKTRDIRFGDFVSADKGKASFYGKVERYELDPSKVKVLGDLEGVYFDEAKKLSAPTPLSLTDIWNQARGLDPKNTQAGSIDFGAIGSSLKKTFGIPDRPPRTALDPDGALKNQVMEEMMQSMPGKRTFSEQAGTMDSSVTGMKSTFPKWVPEDLRSTKLFNEVLEDLSGDIAPKAGTKRAELYEIAQNQISERLGLPTDYSVAGEARIRSRINPQPKAANVPVSSPQRADNAAGFSTRADSQMPRTGRITPTALQESTQAGRTPYAPTTQSRLPAVAGQQQQTRQGLTGQSVPGQVVSNQASTPTVPPRSGIGKIGNDAAESAGKLSDKVHDLYAKTLDRFHPLTRTAQKAGQKAPMEEALAGHYGAGSTATYHIDYELKPILQGVDANDLRAYTIAKRDLELAQRGVKGSDANEANAVLQQLQQKPGFQNIEQSAQKLYDLQNKLVKEYLVDTGVISKEAYGAMRANNQAYVPFKRIMDTVDEAIGISSAPGSVGRQNIVYGIKGSQRKIHDPLESIIENIYKTVSLGKRQQVAQTIANLSDQLPDLIKPVQNAKGPTVSVFKDGKKMMYSVTPEIEEAAKALNEESLNTIVRILAAPTRVFRATATGVNPDFMFPNIARDLQSAFINAGVNPIDYVRGLAHYFKGDKVYQQWLKAGGQLSRISLDKPYIKRTVGELTSKGTKVSTPRQLFDLFDPRKIYRGLEKLGQASEQPTRIAAFERSLRKGNTSARAAYAAQESSVNFARRGSATQSVNALYAFMNARAQGLDRLVRTGIKQPGTTATRLGLITMTPALSLYAYNRQFPEYFDDRIVPQYEKDTNFILMAPWLGKNRYIKITKGDIGRLANPIESFLTYADGEATDMKEAITSTLASFLPGNNIGDVIPTALRPLVEAGANKNFFTGYDIVPEYKEGYPKHKQDNPSTEPIYRQIGQAINQSPAQLQNLTRGYLTGFARMGESASRLFAPSQFKTDRNEQGDVINRIPVIRRFVGGEKKTEEEERISSEKSEASKKFQINDIKSGVKRGDLTPEEGQAAINKILGEGTKTTEKPPLFTNEAGASEGVYELAGRLYSKDPGVDSIDLEKINGLINMSPTTALERATKEKEVWSTVNQLTKFPEEVQRHYLEKLGVSQEDAEYYSIAKLDNSIKSAHVIEDLVPKFQDHGELMDQLAMLRKEINGEKVLADGVIDELFNAEIISTAEKKYLKSLKTDPKTGKVAPKKGAAKKGRKPPKITVGRVSVAKVPQVRATRRRSRGSTGRSTGRLTFKLPPTRRFRPQQQAPRPEGIRERILGK